MNPLTQLREAGHSVKLVDSNQIFVHPTPPVEWVPELRTMKTQIIEALKSEQQSMTEALEAAAQNLPITPAEIREALSPEDIEDWQNGEMSNENLAAFASVLVQRREMDQGKRPGDFTKHATCKHCGPVWLRFAGEVLGCPWCWNRARNRPIPRPYPIRCGDCMHFARLDHPHLGRCNKGEPEPAAGLWDTTEGLVIGGIAEKGRIKSLQVRIATENF